MQLGETNIAVPDLVLYEIANALRYNNDLTKDDVEKAIFSIIDMKIDIIVPTKEILSFAISFAFKYDITLYDSYFLALAKELEYKLITADKNLYDKTKSLDFVELLEDSK